MSNLSKPSLAISFSNHNKATSRLGTTPLSRFCPQLLSRVWPTVATNKTKSPADSAQTVDKTSIHPPSRLSVPYHTTSRKKHYFPVFLTLPQSAPSIAFSMAIRTPVTTSGIYFITFTCHQWLPLIKLVNGYDLVYNWFDVLSEKGHTLTGYVIMPNHLHMLLHYSGIGHSLNTVVGNGKRFMGYDIIERLEQQGQNRLLRRLQKAVEPGDKKRGKKH